MPYVGFEIPLLWISVPFALAMVMAFGLRLPARAKTVPPFSGAAAARENTGNRSLLPMLIPFAVILVPMLAIRIWPGKAPDPGLAFIFVLGALSVWAINTKLSVRDVARDSLDLSLPILGILAGAGMFVSAMTATGARGLMASSALLLPGTWLLLAAMCIIPLFGAISAYASASVLGVPFLLAFIGKGDIAVAAAISAMAAVGDLMPPIALVPSLSLNVFEQPPPRGKVIRLGLLAAVFLVLLAAGLIYKVRYL